MADEATTEAAEQAADTTTQTAGESTADGQQDETGLIRIIYDYSRTGERLILMASFREEDVLTGRADSASVQLRQLVSQGTGGRQEHN